MEKRVAPSILRNNKPEVVRFVWYVKAIDDFGNISFHTGFTWGGITDLRGRKAKSILDLRFVDLKRNKVYTVNLSMIEEFLQSWADSYTDPKWSPKKSSWVVQDKT